MNAPRFLRPLLLTLLYGAVSGVGVAAAAMPMSGSPVCTMFGHGNRMCPMSAASHLRSWQDTFRAALGRRPALHMSTAVAALTPALADGAVGRVRERLRPSNGPPGFLPLFVLIVGRGVHQRLTYG